MGDEFIVFHIGTGEMLKRSNEVTDRGVFLREVWQSTFPETEAPRPFQLGCGQDSRLVMPPLVCI